MDSPKTRRAVIIGATSGIGYEVAQLLLAEGWYLGIAGRRRENLLEFQKIQALEYSKTNLILGLRLNQQCFQRSSEHLLIQPHQRC